MYMYEHIHIYIYIYIKHTHTHTHTHITHTVSILLYALHATINKQLLRPIVFQICHFPPNYVGIFSRRLHLRINVRTCAKVFEICR